MEQRIVNVILRWMWLFVLMTIGGGVAAYWYGIQQPTDYEASVRLIVGPGVDGLSPDLNDLRAGAQLMSTYSELATTRPILQAVIEDVGLQESPDRLARRIAVRDNAEAQILSIFVQDGDPVRSAAIANSIANVLLRLSPSGGESPAAVVMGQIRGQAAELEENIATIEERISQLESDLQSATTAQEQQLYIDQLAQERTRLAESRATMATLLNSMLDTPTNQVKIVEPAIVGIPLSQPIPLLVLIGSAAGLLLSGVAVLAYEYLDKSIKYVDDLEEATGIGVMGTVVLEDLELYGKPESLTVRASPDSKSAEEYRRLATRLPLLGQTDQIRAIVITGLDDRIGTMGTNEIAANLAVVLAQTGIQVLLVDANLKSSTAHTQFDLPDSRGGLTDLLHSRTSNPPLNTVAEVPGLNVLTSGHVSSDAFSELSSPLIRELLADLRKRVDVVVVAAPPLSVAASLILTSHADGVVLVAERGKSNYGSLEDATSHLNAVGVRLVGLVLATRKPALPIWLRDAGRTVAERIRDIVRPIRDRIVDGRASSSMQPADASGPVDDSAQNGRWSSTLRGLRRSVGEAGDYLSDRVRSGVRSSTTTSGSEQEESNASAIEHDSTNVEKTAEGDSVDATEETVVTS